MLVRLTLNFIFPHHLILHSNIVDFSLIFFVISSQVRRVQHRILLFAPDPRDTVNNDNLVRGNFIEIRQEVSINNFHRKYYFIQLC